MCTTMSYKSYIDTFASINDCIKKFTDCKIHLLKRSHSQAKSNKITDLFDE